MIRDAESYIGKYFIKKTKHSKWIVKVIALEQSHLKVEDVSTGIQWSVHLGIFNKQYKEYNISGE